MERAIKLCEALARMGALVFGDYVLKSGIRTMYYLDTAVLANDPASFTLATEALCELVEKVTRNDFDKVVAPLGKGASFASVIAVKLGKPFALVAEDDVVMGSINANERVILVDDVVSTGSTLASYAERVGDEGAMVTGAFALIDREEGGKEALPKFGVKLYAVITTKELAETLFSLGFISEEERDVLLGGT